MKIVFTSDWHNYKLGSSLEGDVFVHSGDISMRGEYSELKDFDAFIKHLNFKHKIVIPGNHDFCFDKRFGHTLCHPVENAIILINNGITIDGTSFWGSPYCPQFGTWAFMEPDNELKKYWDMIPENTDVLVTHAPPFGILDYSNLLLGHAGSRTLRDRLNVVSPKIHAFGHIHEGHGMTICNNTTFLNTSAVDENYVYRHPPMIVEL